MRKFILFVMATSLSFWTAAQSFNMCSSTSTTNASGQLFDSGGPSGDYGDNEDCGFLINPTCATSITLTFAFLDMESCCDDLNIYDGVDNSGTLLLNTTGSTLPSPVTATSGTMYVEFLSDVSVSGGGFEASWSSVIGGQTPITASYTASTTNPAYQQPVTFTDNSNASPGTWAWDFGDGTTSSLQNPTHTFPGSGAYTVTLIASNCTFSDTTSQTITVQPPSYAVSPDTFFANLTCGAPGAGSFTFYNNDATSQTINTPDVGGETPLDTVLARLNSNFASITSQVPSLFLFTDGVTGSTISDGGNDMYDTGNQMNTNFTTGINYSDNTIINSADFGTNGRYFTRKVPGLFVMAADVDNVSTFSITGNLGADGNGISDGTVLTRNLGGDIYTGFVNRTYDAGDPSINRLIIVKNNPSATHTFLTTTGDEDHEVSNLSGSTRIYYILFAASGGLYLDDNTVGNVMDEFLNLLNSGVEMNFTPSTTTVAANDSTTVNFTIDITGLLQGTYEQTIRVNVGNPVTSFVEIPAVVNISGTASITLSDSCITFPALLTKETITDTLTYSNSGCDTLNINNIAFDNGDYTMLSNSGDILPGQSGTIVVQFRPTVAGIINANMTLTTNLGDTVICLSGEGLAPPITFGSHPDTLFATIPCGAPFDTSFTVYNNYAGSLQVDIPLIAKQTPLDTVLARVNRFYSDIVAPVSSLYLFTDGVTGNSISDGGNDMYDTGNILNTNFNSGINYSDNTIINSAAFGTEGRYFTRKVPGLFVMGADIDNVSTFSITGNLGADGSGNSDGTVLTRMVNGVTYTGFVNRTYNAGDPSINRLIIVENNPSATHTFLTNTSNEDHEVSNLSGGTRIYYLMFAASNGLYVNDNTIGNVMDEFVALMDTTHILKFTPGSATIPAGDSLQIAVNIDVSGFFQGTYYYDVEVNAGAPFNYTFVYPAVLDVIGTAEISQTDTCINFPTTVSGVPFRDTIRYTNTGCDTLEVLAASIADPNFILDSITGDLLPGQTGVIIIRFDPALGGNYSANMTFTTNISNDPICLTGAAQNIVSNFSYSAQDPCNAAIHFTEESVGTVTSYSWDFGDGSTSSDPNPSHIYDSLGTYTVTFIVCNAQGCDTTTQSITISTLPAYAIEVSGNLTVNGGTIFDVTGNGISTVTWDFGDGSGTPGFPITHNYADTGTYVVTADVLASGPCLFSLTTTVTITELVDGSPEAMAAQLRMFPNPTEDNVVLTHHQWDGKPWSVQIVNMLGAEVQQLDNIRSNTAQLDLKLDAGVYMVYVTNEAGATARKQLIIRK